MFTWPGDYTGRKWRSFAGYRGRLRYRASTSDAGVNMIKSVAELMQVPTSQHDVSWLQDSLQVALELELSTLPPYLCAAYSIDGTAGGDPSQT